MCDLFAGCEICDYPVKSKYRIYWYVNSLAILSFLVLSTPCFVGRPTTFLWFQRQQFIFRMLNVYHNRAVATYQIRK